MPKHFHKILVSIVILLCIASCKTDPKVITTKTDALTYLEGTVFGTSYNIIYNSQLDFADQVDSIFYIINKSMSTYQTNSDISRLNRNEEVFVDAHFLKVYNASKSIYKETHGAFDPTIGAIVNAWDFGPEGQIVALDSAKITDLMTGVGLDKVSLINKKIMKPHNTYLDFNAIAKGYAVDVVAEFFENREISDYLVEIGGEMRTKGTNVDKQLAWTVGIEEPHYDGKRSILKTLELRDESMATSGNYRKFKIDEEGNRYSHIINTKTGYPDKSNIISISVIANSCMVADAYATALKSMEMREIEALMAEHLELKVFLIFEDVNKNLETVSFNGFGDNLQD